MHHVAIFFESKYRKISSSLRHTIIPHCTLACLAVVVVLLYRNINLINYTGWLNVHCAYVCSRFIFKAVNFNSFFSVQNIKWYRGYRKVVAKADFNYTRDA